jgi:structure-specific recognition protein 1
VPRGRYEADIYANLIRLRGKSYDYKIPYSSILKIFLLPRPDDVHVAMVIALDPPLRQGQTRYPFLIIQFSRDSEIDTTLSLSDDLKAQFEGKLQDSYEGPLYEIFSTILKTVADKRIIVPGSFKSATSSSCVKCSLKANEGHLYLLERSFLFIQKPVILIPHEDLIAITFSR